eukprot:CAMPEP_0172913258 /NCGR_PEP_ID=MMETSP1075-20121228/190032_1 /TAXON_ID=2916 /ORGANISM="Ceratium fusus, Strain PA161109" /LENGTH=66 /DNA_ID=CAMNT_0013771935 /DNA_START=96 /DNA_END=293 /DNA_ORIENTATION=+
MRLEISSGSLPLSRCTASWTSILLRAASEMLLTVGPLPWSIFMTNDPRADSMLAESPIAECTSVIP